MRFSLFFAISVLLVIAGPGHTAPLPPQQQTPPPAKNTPASQSPIITKTRLITVDVVATDSHGNAIRDLKKEDFQIFEERNREQQIAGFRYIDRAADASVVGSATSTSAHFFSNVSSRKLAIPPTILLMDALNTDVTNQMEIRRHMLTLLKTLPANTPVAVFVLGRALREVQGFSTDSSLLHAAVDRALRPLPSDQNPQDDSQSPSNLALDQTDPSDTSATQALAIQALENFESQQYEAQMAIRVDETTDAMVEIANYLAGYSGRKNLIWFSEAFPVWLAPNADFGSNPFSGSASYGEKVRVAGEALSNAQVAVYPVDAKGLAVADLYSANQNPHINRQNPGRGFADQLNRQSGAHLDAQASMDAVAESTGGRTCKNTNDLAGCVQTALNDGSSYYELDYYPQGIQWDGHFHRIAVKTVKHGVKIEYRRGYLATDTHALPQKESPDLLLQQACKDPLPSTSIVLTAEAIAPEIKSAQTNESRYLTTVSSSALTFAPAAELRQLNLRIAVCEFNPKGDAFQFYSRDLSRPVPDELFQSWQSLGIKNILDYGAKPESKRLRFAVVDVPSGEFGSLDVPAHPSEVGTLSAAPAPVLAFGPAAKAPLPVAPAGESLQTIATSITFRGSSGQRSLLSWRGDSVSYRGTLSVDLGAAAFFRSAFARKFHCEEGNLVPNDADSKEDPKLTFVFQGLDGHTAVVNLSGAAPQYSGDLSVDPDTKPFFDQVWKMSHCQ